MKQIIFYIVLILSSLSMTIHSQTIMTREEAAQYALRAAKALNISVWWLSTSELPVGEEVYEDEIDKVDKYALMGVDYENIVSVTKRFPIGKSHFLDDINYYFPCDYGYIIVNAFSGATYVIGKFPTNISELNEQQIISLASNIVNTFFGSIDHEWKIDISSTDGFITVYFSSYKSSIGLKLGRRFAEIEFNRDGSISSAYFYPLPDNVMISITIEQAKQLLINELNSDKEVYLITIQGNIIKQKLPKIRFVCFGIHPEAVNPSEVDSLILPRIPAHFPGYGEGLYFCEEDYFLQPKYVYAILVTIEFIEYTTKVWTYYLIDVNTGEIEGYGIKDIYLAFLGPGKISGLDIKKFRKEFEKIFILNDKLIKINDIIFENNRIYVSQNYLSVFKTILLNNKLYGHNGVIYLKNTEIKKYKNKLYIPLYKICEVNGIRVYWDNNKKIPILRSEWLKYRKFLK